MSVGVCLCSVRAAPCPIYSLVFVVSVIAMNIFIDALGFGERQQKL